MTMKVTAQESHASGYNRQYGGHAWKRTTIHVPYFALNVFLTNITMWSILRSETLCPPAIACCNNTRGGGGGGGGRGREKERFLDLLALPT